MQEETALSNRLAGFRGRLYPKNEKGKLYWWDVANLCWALATKGVLGLTATLTFIFIIHLFYGVLFQRSVVIEPIAAPKDIQERGYTPDVAALHLRDALNKYAEHARTSAAGPELALQKELADFVLPTVGLSFEAIVAQIRTFFRIERRQNISGEITRVDNQLRLRLRKNGVIIHESPVGADSKDLEALFVDAAAAVFSATAPYFAAVAQSREDPEAAFKFAKKIVADQSSSDWNVAWAHNLLGSLLQQKHRLDDTDGAIAEFERAINLDPNFAVAHLNLGTAYNEQGLTDHAINEFRSAIRMDPELAIAHMNLGDTLDQMGDVRAARCEYLEAIIKFHQAVVASPFSAGAHQRLGAALKKKQEADKAADCAYPQSSLKEFADYDGAIDEYQRAVMLDNDEPQFHYDLGVELLEILDQLDSSIEELEKALRGRNTSNDFRYKLLKALSRAWHTKGINSETLGDNQSARSAHQRAGDLLERAYAETRRVIYKGNAAAYKMLDTDLYFADDFVNAMEAHGHALEIDKDYLANRNDRGYARFALGDFEGAADDFARAMAYPKDRAYTMIWLYLSRERFRLMLGEAYYRQRNVSPIPFMELLNNASQFRESNRKDWPSPIIELFLNNRSRSPADVLDDAKSVDDKCEADFYVGEWFLLHNKREDAMKLLRQAINVCRPDFVELPGARSELKRLGG